MTFEQTLLSMMDDFYETEFKQIERIIKNPPHWLNVQQAKEQAIDKCLGVAFFLNDFGVAEEEVEKRYNTIKERIYKIKQVR